MMKKSLRLGLVLVLLLTTFTVASADYTGPYYDTWLVDSNGVNNPISPQLKVTDSSAVANCDEIEITYFQFDVSVFGTVNTASLELTHASTLTAIDQNPVLTMYGVNDFNQATLDGTNNPSVTGAYVIQDLVIPSTTTLGTKILFGGANPGLRNYIQTEQIDKGDTLITLALSFSANCNANNTTVNFYSQEYNTNTALRPLWTITGTKPNSVTLTDSSAQQTNSLPLYVGLGALALVAVAGVGMSRRRTAAR